MLTNSKIVLSLALVLATASGAIAAPHKPAVHHQTATARHLPANANLDTRSAASGESVNSVNPCYLKIQTIGNREGNGITPRNYSCVRHTPGQSSCLRLPKSCAGGRGAGNFASPN